MDIRAVQNALRAFIKSHRTQFENLSSHGTHLLEMAGLAVVSEHYRRSGYHTEAENLFENRFRVKTGSRGYPHNFSWFVATRGSDKFEIHSNLAVAGHYGEDGGIYVVDVGVIRSGSTRTKADWKRFGAVDNSDLETFVEAKKLVVYPMLIAQFIGIVHELKPQFLRGQRPHKFLQQDHFYPLLISIGHLHGTAERITHALTKRRLLIHILPHFDITLAKMRGDPWAPSPLSDPYVPENLKGVLTQPQSYAELKFE